MPMTAASPGKPVIKIPVQYDIDEWYPVYSIVDEDDYNTGMTVNVTQEFYDEFMRAHDTFMVYQRLLRKHIKEEGA